MPPTPRLLRRALRFAALLLLGAISSYGTGVLLLNHLAGQPSFEYEGSDLQPGEPIRCMAVRRWGQDVYVGEVPGGSGWRGTRRTAEFTDRAIVSYLERYEVARFNGSAFRLLAEDERSTPIYVKTAGWPWRCVYSWQSTQDPDNPGAPRSAGWAFIARSSTNGGRRLIEIPLTIRWTGFAANSMLHAIAFAGLISLPTAVLARWRRCRSRCPRCGYSLAGLAEEALCPECGARKSLEKG